MSTEEVFLGTGFFFNSKGFILTAAHLFNLNGKDLTEVKIKNFTEVTYSKSSHKEKKEVTLICDVKFLFKEIDMAILEVRKGTHTYEIFPYTRLYNSNYIYEGQSIGVCAFIPDNYKNKKAFISSGIVSTLRRNEYLSIIDRTLDFIQSDLNIAKGTSGGPIFDLESGRVIAIQTGGLYLKNSVHTSYSIGVLIDQIFPKLDSLKIIYDKK